jgi:uncharacterized protein Yka (UPF0111/DUF47 family)
MSRNGRPRLVPEVSDEALLLPDAVVAALAANDRAGYCLALLRAAAEHALRPDEPAFAPALAGEREAAGIDHPELDGVVAASRQEEGALVVPHAPLLHQLVVDSVEEMIAPLATAAAAGATGAAVAFHDRLRALTRDLPRPGDERVAPAYVAAMTRPDPGGSDSLHQLVADVHRELHRLHEALSRDAIGVARVYALDDGDRALVSAFTAGVARTAPLWFGHPAPTVTATRSGGALLLQVDLATVDVHLALVRASSAKCSLTVALPSLQETRVLQGLLAATGLAWGKARARGRSPEDGEGYHVCTGRLAAPDRLAVVRFLDALGANLVFLVDWNRARRCLRSFIDGPACLEVLRWAADAGVGPRALLQLGGERLVYEAIEHAAPSPLRYGQRLDEIVGRPGAIELMRFVLRAASEGLALGRSDRFIRDEIRAELLGRFETFAQGLLGIAAEHAIVVAELAVELRAVLERADAATDDELGAAAARAAVLETRADALVERVRTVSRRDATGEMFTRLLAQADDVADGLEEASFLLTLLSPAARGALRGHPLLKLAEGLVSAAEEWGRCVAAAGRVRRGGDRGAVQPFLEAVERVVVLEHASDDTQRTVTAALFRGGLDGPALQLLLMVAQALEEGADALARCAQSLRDHLLRDVMPG